MGWHFRSVNKDDLPSAEVNRKSRSNKLLSRQYHGKPNACLGHFQPIISHYGPRGRQAQGIIRAARILQLDAHKATACTHYVHSRPEAEQHGQCAKEIDERLSISFPQWLGRQLSLDA